LQYKGSTICRKTNIHFSAHKAASIKRQRGKMGRFWKSVDNSKKCELAHVATDWPDTKQIILQLGKHNAVPALMKLLLWVNCKFVTHHNNCEIQRGVNVFSLVSLAPDWDCVARSSVSQWKFFVTYRYGSTCFSYFLNVRRTLSLHHYTASIIINEDYTVVCRRAPLEPIDPMTKHIDLYALRLISNMLNTLMSHC
jgi:hypothetical protein